MKQPRQRLIDKNNLNGIPNSINTQIKIDEINDLLLFFSSR